jgi:DNA-binding transcriptional regulator GbsR (MarR family)
MARSNVSNSLKELLGWKLIHRTPVLGDRRDHYEAEADLWRILTRIAEGRREREVDPAMAAIRSVLEKADGDPTISPVAKKRIHEMHAFVSTLDSWFTQMMAIPPSTLMTLIKMGSKVVGVLGLGARKEKSA